MSASNSLSKVPMHPSTASVSDHTAYVVSCGYDGVCGRCHLHLIDACDDGGPCGCAFRVFFHVCVKAHQD